MKEFLLELARRAREAGLEFLIIGGHAVSVLGRPRGTRDVDLLIQKSDEGGWNDLLLHLSYSEIFRCEPFVQYSSSKSLPLPDVDLMIVEGETFSQMLAAGVKPPGVEGELSFPCPEHLIALKLHAMKSREGALQEQDWADILSVAEKNGLSPDEHPLDEIIAKFGPPGIRQRWDSSD